MQKSAQTHNKTLLRPWDCVEYHRLGSIADQARRATEYLTTRYSNGNGPIVGVAAILEDLQSDLDVWLPYLGTQDAPSTAQS